MSYAFRYMPNNQVFPWSKWNNVLLIFAYFAHIFHSPCKTMLLVGVSFWYYDIISMLQKLVNSWYKTDGLSLVAMLICMCLNLLFTFFGLFLSLISFKTFIVAIPVIYQVTFSSVLHGWLLFFVLPPGFWTALMPHWHDISWLICKENCRSKDHKRMKSIYPWNPV